MAGGAGAVTSRSSTRTRTTKPDDDGGESETGRLEPDEEPRLDCQREASELAVGDRPSLLLPLAPVCGVAVVGVEGEALSPDVILPAVRAPATGMNGLCAALTSW